MNVKTLRVAEEKFMMMYPGGFDNPEMVEIGKKHKVDKISAQVQEDFIVENFKDIEEMSEKIIKIVTRSSMVSLFEKPKFRDHVRSLSMEDKTLLVEAIKELMHGDEEKGFNQLTTMLKPYKLAKWTLVSVFLAYYRPTYDVFLKPTTVKGVINTFELEGLKYSPTPTYEFYVKYREAINEMKTKVDGSLSPNNPAFSGFLMMVMEK
jgi:hypothetical protein